MSAFNKVLTLCSYCKEKIAVDANYEDRNKKYFCEKHEENKKEIE